jgi:hypothetical protein
MVTAEIQLLPPERTKLTHLAASSLGVTLLRSTQMLASSSPSTVATPLPRASRLSRPASANPRPCRPLVPVSASPAAVLARGSPPMASAAAVAQGGGGRGDGAAAGGGAEGGGRGRGGAPEVLPLAAGGHR